jgi:hypothetical protein
MVKGFQERFLIWQLKKALLYQTNQNGFKLATARRCHMYSMINEVKVYQNGLCLATVENFVVD